MKQQRQTPKGLTATIAKSATALGTKAAWSIAKSGWRKLWWIKKEARPMLFMKTGKVETVDDGDPNVYYRIKADDYSWIVGAWFVFGFLVGRFI